MKRLSLEELKSKKPVVKKLEAIKGGTADSRHTKEKPTNLGGSAADPL